MFNTEIKSILTKIEKAKIMDVVFEMKFTANRFNQMVKLDCESNSETIRVCMTRDKDHDIVIATQVLDNLGNITGDIYLNVPHKEWSVDKEKAAELKGAWGMLADKARAFFDEQAIA